MKMLELVTCDCPDERTSIFAWGRRDESHTYVRGREELVNRTCHFTTMNALNPDQVRLFADWLAARDRELVALGALPPRREQQQK